MNIHQGHRKRMRELYHNAGLDSLPEHTVLEIMLYYAIPQGNTNELAHELINHFGSIQGVFDASYDELLNFKGLGEVSATMFKFVPEVTSYVLSRKALQRGKVSSGVEAGEYFTARLLNAKVEELHMMSLDARGNIIKCTKMHEGTVNVVQIVTRKIMAEALSTNASAIILAHNHPSGVTIPSTNDVFVTKTLYNVLYQSDIFMMDHMIVSGNNFSSMRELGWFDGLPVFSDDIL